MHADLLAQNEEELRFHIKMLEQSYHTFELIQNMSEEDMLVETMKNIDPQEVTHYLENQKKLAEEQTFRRGRTGPRDARS
jgi:hypothetical protein